MSPAPYSGDSMSRRAAAVLPVRDGLIAPGGDEAAAEAEGRTILIGSGAADAAAGLSGVVATAEAAEVGDYRPGAWAAALAPLLGDATHVVLPASPDGRDLATRLAAELGWPLLGGAVLVTPERVTVARHGGLHQEVLEPGGPFVATLQPGVRGVDRNDDGPPSISHLGLELAPSHEAEVLEVLPPDPATTDLSEATRIVGGGAGLLQGDGAQSFARLTAVGHSIGASMGATRVVTDAGFVGHERQIGTTGVVVDPRLYLAFGISGAVQHTAGLGHPDHVISVNTDPHCPMMALADLAVVADAAAVLDELASRLGAESEYG